MTSPHYDVPQGVSGLASAVRAETQRQQHSEKAAPNIPGDFEPGLLEDRHFITVTQKDAYARGAVDFNFFSGLMIPDVCTDEWPPIFLAMWTLLTTRTEESMGKVLRFALGLPRGFAKTTFIKLVICWLIAYDKVTYMLIVAATEDLASNILGDINEMLSSDNAEAVYGKWHDQLITNNSREKVCYYHGRRVKLYGLGAFSSVRGIAKDNQRPDFILCDDMQTKENDESEADSLRLRKWFTMTLLKCISPRGDRVIAYLGNMYSEQCILYQLKIMKEWTTLITGAILANGESLWPSLHPLESIIESFFHDEQLGMADDWYAEIMNDPRAASTKLLTAPLPIPPADVFECAPSGAFITIDPAGFRKASDDNVIVAHELRGEDLCVAKMEGGNLNPEEVVLTAIEMALDFRASVIGVEATGYQQTLCFWLDKYLSNMNLHESIIVVELSPHGRAKESRIREQIAEFTNERYWILREEDRNIYSWYAHLYKVGKRDNRDDWLDAPAYGLDVRREYMHLVQLIPNTPEPPRRQAPIVYNTLF